MDSRQKLRLEPWSALISNCGESEVQEKLDGVKRNKDVYLNLSRKLQELGYSWTRQQCRTKIKNLTQNYRKVRLLVGSNKYFDTVMILKISL